MTENEMLKIAIHCLSVQSEQEVCEECPVYLESGIACREVARVAISALKEVQQYREIGTVEQVKNQKENLKIAYQIISDYEAIGTVEECRELASIVEKAERNELAKIIDEWLKYRKIGTVEECREAVEKQKPKKPVKDKYNHNCCPNCGWIVSGEGGYGEEFCPHCENCGQAIAENLEGMEENE